MRDEMGDEDGSSDTAQPAYASLLRDLQVATSKCGDALQASHDKYEKLLEKYKALQSENTGEAMAVPDTNKAIAGGYILVVVDAHSHNFKDNHLHGAESGGAKAARLLKEAVAGYLTGTHPETRDSQIIIRVYANLKTLSPLAAEQYAARKHGYKEPTFPRGLGTFAAGFSRDDVSVDYIDVADENAVERKICGLFKMHVKDPQCQRIFFGASGSARYVGTLSEHLMYAEKITLIQRGAEDTSLVNLGLGIVTFAEVFNCLKGNTAIFKHTGTLTSSSGGYTENDVEPLRRAASNTSRSLFEPKQKPLGVSATPEILLPLQNNSGRIPINAAGHRIDTYLDPPTSMQWIAHKAHMSQKKLCSPFHLGKGCNVEQCLYDHNPITPDVRDCMRYALRNFPCYKSGACRDALCFMGHTCRHRGCKGGRNMHCKLPVKSHRIDLVVAEWITPGQVTRKVGETESSKEDDKASMESWGARVGVLIDI